MKSKIARNLFHDLLYPAVLGTFILDVILSVSRKLFAEQFDFFNLFNWSTFFWCKIALVLGLLGFYCADFLYSKITKEFKRAYVRMDTVVIIGLIVAFKAVPLDQASKPNLFVIIIPFLIFFGMFYWWDTLLITKLKGPPPASEFDTRQMSFYGKLKRWQLCCLIALVVLLVLLLIEKDTFWDFSYYGTTVVILASAVYYLVRAHDKEKLEDEKRDLEKQQDFKAMLGKLEGKKRDPEKPQDFKTVLEKMVKPECLQPVVQATQTVEPSPKPVPPKQGEETTGKDSATGGADDKQGTIIG